MSDELDTGWVEPPKAPPEEIAEQMNHVNRTTGEYLFCNQLFKARVSSI